MIYLKKILIAIADDHIMLRKGLVKLLLSYGNMECVFEADSGDEVRKAIKKNKLPDVIILDINMGNGNGVETASWLQTNYPQIKILALSMFQDEATILKMIQAGANGYMTKNSEPEELKYAIETIYEKGFYLPSQISSKILLGIRKGLLNNPIEKYELNPKEKQFLALLCKEYSYQEIAQKMYVSTRTIDDYRKKLSQKLKVRGRAGLIIYAIKQGLSEDNY